MNNLSPDTAIALLKANEAQVNTKLRELNNGVRVDQKSTVEETAKDFEAMFVAEMMKPMFQGLDTGGLFGGGKTEEVFRGLMLQEYGKMMAETGQLGIADAVKTEMIKMQEEVNGATNTSEPSKHSDQGGVILSSNPQKAMQEMMDIIDSLRTVMDAETQAIQSNEGLQRFSALQDEKLKAARQYQEGVSQMIERKEEMKRAPAAIKKALEKKRADFSQTAQNNMQALDYMRNGMERLSKRIMQTAKKEAEVAQKFSYGAHGKLEGSGKASIGVNESA